MFKVLFKRISEPLFQILLHLVAADVVMTLLQVQQTGLVFVRDAVENFCHRSDLFVYEAGVGKIDYPTRVVGSETLEMFLVSVLENFDNLL